MKTSELTGAALDWAVAKCEGVPVRWGSKRKVFLIPDIPGVTWKPSTDWSLMGPIIEREHISLNQRQDGWWGACIQYNYDDEARSIQLSHWPLISAARCFVQSKLGDDVVIPEELL
jgi:hypothetical protein